MLNQYGSFILLLVIIFLVWVFAKHNPEMEAKLSELEIEQAVERLTLDIQDCQTLTQLFRLHRFMDIITGQAKKQTGNWLKYDLELKRAYYIRKYYLVSVEHEGIPQNLIPYLSN